MLAGKFIVSKIAAIFFTSVVQKSSQFNVQAEQKLALAVAVAALIRQVIGRILLGRYSNNRVDAPNDG